MERKSPTFTLRAFEQKAEGDRSPSPHCLQRGEIGESDKELSKKTRAEKGGACACEVAVKSGALAAEVTAEETGGPPVGAELRSVVEPPPVAPAQILLFSLGKKLLEPI